MSLAKDEESNLSPIHLFSLIINLSTSHLEYTYIQSINDKRENINTKQSDNEARLSTLEHSISRIEQFQAK